MQRNFKFDDFSVIVLGDRFVDLHNAYNLESFGTDESGTAVTLTFVQNQHAIDPENLPLRVSLHCTGDVRIAFNNINLIAAPLNDEGIEIAYFDQACDWDAFITEEIALVQPPLGLHVEFMNGFVIRIFCDLVTLELRQQC